MSHLANPEMPEPGNADSLVFSVETTKPMPAPVREVEIQSADREVWAATGLDRALTCVENVKRSLILSAELLREEKTAEGNRFFVHCVEGLERFFEIMVLTRAALKLDFAKIQVEGISLQRVEGEFTSVLRSILEFQEKRDYISVADKVEYELLTNLCLWSSALRALRNSRHSNA